MSAIFAFDVLVAAPPERLGPDAKMVHQAISAVLDFGEGDVLSRPKKARPKSWGLTDIGQFMCLGGCYQMASDGSQTRPRAVEKAALETSAACPGSLVLLAYAEQGTQMLGVIAMADGKRLGSWLTEASILWPAVYEQLDGWEDIWSGDTWGPDLVRSQLHAPRFQTILAPWRAAAEALVLQGAVPAARAPSRKASRL